MSPIEEYLQSNARRFQELLFEWLRIPSVSAIPECKGDVHRAGQWLQDYFTSLGLTSELIRTEGHPLVYAETPPVSGAPVVLVYGHYDVQPADPLERWDTPPFEPTERDGNIYARGASDDKGQLLTHVFAAEACMQGGKRLPFQIKFIIEGEEEVGSASLSKYLKENRKKLAANCVLVSDGCMFGPAQPAITYGLRGIVAMEMTLRGPSRDLHSGVFGGAVMNPAVALTRMLAAAIDENGKIRIPDFYKDVLPITESEHTQFSMLPFNEEQFFEKIGVAKSVGEKGFTSLERRWSRPSFDINGLTSGYQGEGSKTVIPSVASAKFTFRLVPNQNPAEIAANAKTFFESIKPEGVSIEIKYEHGAAGMVVDIDESKFIPPAAAALEQTFGRPPVFTREGGSIPIVAELSQVLKAETLLIGWGQDDDNAHSPNEKFSIGAFRDGILASARFWAEVGRSAAVNERLRT
ncbi:MAG TPA: dipeptidase [Planctomycetaceae bacterium]|nr:dipeptidase [Planctomycetaceae bacterium]